MKAKPLNDLLNWRYATKKMDPSKVVPQEKGLRSVVLMPLGYRDEAGDWLLSMSKVRKSRDTIVTEVK